MTALDQVSMMASEVRTLKSSATGKPDTLSIAIQLSIQDCGWR
jgi:hypothetical protein